MKKNEKINVVFLLDRSGSMYDCIEDTIGGYNSYLDSQRKTNATITTILFNDYYEILHNKEDIKNVKNITAEEYYVSGCTALYDAIGKTINMFDKTFKNEKVLFVITTDGLENDSIIYNKQQIRDLIKKHSKWEFMYLGANIDSYLEGGSIGIEEKNIANYGKSKKCIDSVFSSLASVSNCMCMDRAISDDWKKTIEETK